VYIPKERITLRPKNFGFTTFETEQGLLNTLAEGERHDIDGVSVAINRAGTRPRRGDAAEEGAAEGGGAGAGAGAGGWQPQQPHQHQHQHQQHQPQYAAGVGVGRGGDGGFPEEKGRGPRLYVGGIDHDVHTDAAVRLDTTLHSRYSAVKRPIDDSQVHVTNRTPPRNQSDTRE
jgi:hypothetical protein